MDAAPSSAPYTNINRKMKLILRTGQLLMENGADTNRAVRDMIQTSAFFQIPSAALHLHVVYTTIIINISDEVHAFTSLEKCRKHDANMDVITAVSRLSAEASAKRLTLDEYEAALNHIERLPRRYPAAFSAFGTGIACAALAIIFGGDLGAAFCTALASVLGFFVRRRLALWEVNPYAGIAVAAFAATFAAWLMIPLDLSATPYIPMIAGSLCFVPGIPLINAVDDLVNDHIIAGLTRAMHTVLIIGAMTFGIVLTIRLGGVADFTTISIVPNTGYLILAVAAALASLGFSVIFNVPPKFLGVTAFGGVIAVVLKNFLNLSLALPLPSSATVGAAAVSLYTLAASRYFRVPTHVISIPCVIPLIPGIPLYRLLFALINVRSLPLPTFLSAAQGGIEAVFILIGISLGVAIPNLVARHRLDRRQRLDAK